jgi:outer membrane receptor protein involved in Fe transport
MFTISKRSAAFLTGLIGMLAVITVFPGSLFADTLIGKVIDPQGRIVTGATLHLFDRRSGQWRTASSNAEGRFVFSNLTAGDYVLEGGVASNALSASIEVSVRGEQSEDLRLEITPTRTDVLVTAVANPQRMEDAAKAIDVVDADTIERRDELSIVETIRTLPGVRVKQLEGPGGLVTIKTRGLRNQDTAVLVDGMRLRDAASPEGDATAFLESMLVVDTDRVEFLRGPSSSLYGSNALAGVINVSSRTGGGKTHGDFRTEGGGLGMIRSTLGVGGGIDSDRLTYSGKVAHLNVTKGVRNGSPYRNTSPQGSVRYAFTPALSATGRVWYANDYLSSSEGPAFTPAITANFPSTGLVPAIALPITELERFERGQSFNAGNATYIPSQIDPDGRRLSSFLNVAGIVEHHVSPETSYRVSYQRVNTKRTYVDGPAGPGPFEPFAPGSRDQFNGYIDVVQARLDQRVGLYNFITAGYEFEREEYFSYSGMDYTANSITLPQRNHALFVQDQIRLLDGQLLVTAAGRAQWFSLRPPAFIGFTNPYSGVSTVEPPTAYTGDGSVAYLIRASNTKLRAHVGNSFRAPSGFERFGGGFGDYYGDPRLASERAVAVDAGIDQRFLDSRLQVSGTIFYTNLQETITFANILPPTDPFGRFFGYANGGGGIARGLEFSAQVSPVWRTKFSASYTYTNSDRRAPTIFGTNYYNAIGISPHAFSFTATHWIGRRINVSYDMSIFSDYTIPMSGAGSRQFVFDGPHKADVVVSYERPLSDTRALEMYVKVDNVFNERAFEDGFVGPKAWVIAGFRLRY